jgi:hypothetical protein
MVSPRHEGTIDIIRDGGVRCSAQEMSWDSLGMSRTGILKDMGRFSRGGTFILETNSRYWRRTYEDVCDENTEDSVSLSGWN